MAEKKLTKKFGQKRDFKSEEKKTYKEPVKSNRRQQMKNASLKKWLQRRLKNHSVRCMENVADVSFWICLMRSN